jgi:hypothetical protein
MERESIVAEIRRTAADNGGIPLGLQAFRRETGIKKTDWYGRFWARWGDALVEAGFSPNQMQEALAEDHLIKKLTELIRELGHFPVEGELRLKARTDPSFPSHTTFSRLGSKRQRAARVLSYCEARREFDDVIAVCRPITVPVESPVETDGHHEEAAFGSVYLLRSGHNYKIGKTNAAGRRERELQIQLPEKAEITHVIRTDDPGGIEAYWHNRFSDKRKNGEWFALSSEDIRAFRRRKFM